MSLTLTAALALLLACSSAAAATCEFLRREIEAKIARAGVADFSVTAVEAGASAPGKVVGTCDQGNMKIMYERVVPGSGRARPEPQAAKPSTPMQRSAERIITECKDGSVVRGGDCKK